MCRWNSLKAALSINNSYKFIGILVVQYFLYHVYDLPEKCLSTFSSALYFSIEMWWISWNWHRVNQYHFPNDILMVIRSLFVCFQPDQAKFTGFVTYIFPARAAHIEMWTWIITCVRACVRVNHPVSLIQTSKWTTNQTNKINKTQWGS